MTHRFEAMGHYGPTKDWEENDKLIRAQNGLDKSKGLVEKWKKEDNEGGVVGEISEKSGVPSGRLPSPEYVRMTAKKEEKKEPSTEDRAEVLAEDYADLDEMPNFEGDKYTESRVNADFYKIHHNVSRHSPHKFQIAISKAMKKAVLLKKKQPPTDIKEEPYPLDVMSEELDQAAD